MLKRKYKGITTMFQR